MSTSPEKIAEALRTSAKETQRLRRQNRELLAAAGEPVAIVGMSCRLPGGAGSPQALWDLLASGRDAISKFPTDRGWDIERLYHPDPDHPGTSYVQEGGFVYDAGEFDAGFFGIAPREALAMDPQQRLFLEASWEAFEDACVDPASARGSQTGVFAGVMYQDYPPDPQLGVAGNMVTSNTGSIVSGRVAYILGLVGPTMTVDTACSSSLVALHLACGALRKGECSMALAGGVTVMGQPSLFVGFSRQRALARDGRCRSFADSADGTNWGEGVGVLLLERLSDAQRRGHRVLAVIRGSAVNQDGASNGFTAPNGPSQQRVIRQALESAGLSTNDVDAVEGHGTATELGDPIEAQALLGVYGHDRPQDRPLWLGSVKSNIAHVQAAAGVAGVIKMVQALNHGVLPRTLHVDAPTKHVDWSTGAVKLLTEPEPWPAGGRPRRAGVSSFGISGTNAHLIIEEAPTVEAPHDANASDPLVLPWLLSAKSGPALDEQAQRLLTHLQEHPELTPSDVAFSLATGRARFEQRAAVVGRGREQLLERLGRLARGEVGSGVLRRTVQSGKTAFMFTGQGAQHAGMGAELYKAFPVFATVLDEACAALDPHLEHPLKELMFAEEDSPQAGLLERTEFAQASLFALELALFGLVRSAGIEPDALIGHSVGEIVAAHVSGVLSLVDACRMVAARGRLMGSMPQGGGMMAIEASEDEVNAGLEHCKQLSLAAVNGPRAVVVSGELEELDAWAAGWRERGRKTSRLRVSHAFHSQLMEPMLEEFRAVVDSLEFNPPRIPMVSNVTGAPAEAAELATADYWVRHVRETVRFAGGIAALEEAGVTRFLELGPDGVLSAMARECLGEQIRESALVTSALRARRSETEAFFAFVAEAHADGVALDWHALLAGSGGSLVGLPTYPFQRRYYWHESWGSAGDLSAAGLREAEHPLLGAVLGHAGDRGWTFSGRLSPATHRWLADHTVLGTVILPGAGFVELALAAGREVECELLEELTLQTPLVLAQSHAVQLQLTVGECDDSGRRDIAIYSREESAVEDQGREGEWECHAVGVLAPSPDAGSLDSALELLQEEAWPPNGAEAVDVASFYDRMADVGLDYGPAFQGVSSAWLRGDEVFAEVRLEPQQAEQATHFGIHPALFDAALHAAMLGSEQPEQGQLLLPFSLKDVRLHSTGCSSLRVRIGSAGEHRMGLAALDEDGAPVLSVGSLVARPVDAAGLRAASGARHDWLFRVDWTQVPGSPAPARPPADGSAPVLALLGDLDGFGLGEEVGERYTDLAALDEAIDAGAPVPDVVLVRATLDEEGEEVVQAAHAGVRRILSLLQEWLTRERLSDSRLVLVTRGGVAVAEEETPDLVTASVWGLARSAQSEHPGRLQLIDLDPAADVGEVPLAALLEAEEPQLALRGDDMCVPRLARAVVQTDAGEPSEDSQGTVLITGGTGGLGALVARHLAQEYGARHLLLVSRRGPSAEGVGELTEELAGLGCAASVLACDVADRDALSRVIDEIPPDRPLTAVIHAAGIVEDGVIESLSAEQLERVMRPKLDAAVHLHELTKDMELSDFVLFSSAAAAIGSPGQASYAAANAFLDAFARHRRANGLAATSLAWGLWAEGVGMTKRLGGSDMARLKRLGVSALSAEDGLRLFDAARMSREALLVPVRLDLDTLRTHARMGVLPALLRGVVRVPARSTGDGGGSLARRLVEVLEAERDAVVLGLVRDRVAAVLGHASSDVVDPNSTFQELGVDSLAAVELRNALDQVTGLRLPATLVFDHPTPVAVASFLRSRVEGAQSTTPVPARRRAVAEEQVAIVGMSCRYPGGVQSPADLWRLVAAGKDAVSSFPEDRGWDLEHLFHPDPDHRGTTHVEEGGFLYDAAEFDAGFFQISPREATAMDPQQRLMLEASWEALETAGIEPRALRGSQTGVFAGVMYQDYGLTAGSALGEEHLGNLMPGTGGSLVSGRVSYHLGLEGPAMTVDTACSSSLVALHLACQALRQGECSLALAGGVTVLSTPMAFIGFSQMRGLAANGRCKSFAATADGVGWSEGAGVLALERLSDARRLGHTVLAVVRGSAVNQDGASNGLTAPNGPSQERVIHQALATAGLSTADIDAVDAHGTGTILGDPIEAQALIATYGQEREPSRPLWLGSVKSNLGHTQAAAGVAGVIKMVMAMRHEQLPRTLHVDEPSQHVDWSAGAVSLLTESMSWERTGTPRRAAISSFGMTGTNAHVIVEEAPAVDESPQEAPAVDELPPLARISNTLFDNGADDLGERHPGVVAWVVSGSDEQAMRAQAGRLHAHVARDPELDVRDVGFSLMRRTAFENRAVVVGQTREQLLNGLGALSTCRAETNVVEGAAARAGKIAFVFPGQGSQWSGMAVELLEGSPLFADLLGKCGQALAPFVDWSLEEVLRAERGAPGFDRVDVVQPTLFAVMVALAGLWRACGVEPDMVVGHSQGEIAAACVAGGLSLEDGARVVALRSRALAALSGDSGMLSVALPEGELVSRLDAFGGKLSLAAVNGPVSMVVSGGLDALRELLRQCEADGVRVREIPVDYAAHSIQVERIRDELLLACSEITPRSGGVPFYSSVTGGLLDTADLDAEYWYRNLRETVRFEKATRALLRDGCRTLVEVSPHPVLAMGVRETAEDALGDLAGGTGIDAGEFDVVGSMRRDDGGIGRFMRSLGHAWTRGAVVDWASLLEGHGAKWVQLPTYAFQREHYWLAAGANANALGLANEAERRDSLFRVDWVSLPATGSLGLNRWATLGADARTLSESLAGAGVAIEAHADPMSLVRSVEAGLPLPKVVLASCVPEQAGSVAAPDVHRAVQRALELTQAWLADERLAESRLVVLTRGAIAVSDDEDSPDLALAAVWGLVRSAQLESPGRFVLVDCDEQAASWSALPRALALDEPHLALREGVVWAPRLARMQSPPPEPPGEGQVFDPLGTVLITGGTGGLGRLVALHLVREHQVPHVMLVSRSGRAAGGAAELESELLELGSKVTIAACDLSEHDAVRTLIESVPAEYPLRGVVHVAGVADDATVGTLTAEQVDRVLAPKVDAALHLDELTSHLDLSAFVMFSSVAGTFGRPGSSNYAAANAFLDALAVNRRSRGLPAVSIGWGLWAQASEISSVVRQADRLRMLHAGADALTAEEGLRLFDHACRADRALAIAVRLPELSVLVETDVLPAMLRGLAPKSARSKKDGRAGSLARGLSAVSEAERPKAALEAVRAEVAAVLGHSSAAAVDPRRGFQELGFDSLTAIELRNRLGTIADLRLPATLVFNYPTSAELADHLLQLITQAVIDEPAPVSGELDQLEAAITTASMDDDEREAVQMRLRALMAQIRDARRSEEQLTVTQEIQSATADEVIAFIDSQLGEL